MIARRLTLATLVSICAVVCGSAVSAASAGAVVSQFGSEGEDAGQFIEPRGLAVDQESGDVYLADRNNSRVEKFGSEGAFLTAWGWGVADGETQALQTCTSACSVGFEGAGAGQFSFPEGGVAVDNSLGGFSHGDVYVVDARNRRVEKFDSNGAFLLMFGGKVNADTKANICLAGQKCQAGTEGEANGQFESADGVSVGPDGTVYVGDANRVQEFTPEGVYVGQITLTGAGSTTALMVDPAGDVYVLSQALAGVREYDGAGLELGKPRDAAGSPQAIAVGPSGELFVDDRAGGHHILEYDSSGIELASFDSGLNDGETGIAFGETLKKLYVLNQSVVRLVDLPSAGPLVVLGSESAGALMPTTATLNAAVNPEGHKTTYHFEYGTSVSYGSSTATEVLAGEGFEDESVNASLTGLQPRTLYHFRVVATNSAGTITGPDETVTTLLPVLIDSESVSGVSGKSALLETTLNPLGSATQYRFEYGQTTNYGTSVPAPDASAGSGMGDVSRGILIERLLSGTTYHYRVVAHNVLGTVEGPDHTFTTQGGEASGLPDGRVSEMVSPSDKKGVSLEALTLEGGVIQAAEDGGGLAYIAKAPIESEPSGNRSIADQQLLATRVADRWATQDIATAHERVVGLTLGNLSEYRAFSADLSVALVEPAGATRLSAQATERTPYLRDATGAFVPLVTPTNTQASAQFGGEEIRSEQFVGGVSFLAGSPDLSHLVISSRAPLTEGLEPSQYENLFDWHQGELELLSVLPDGYPASREGHSADLGRTDVAEVGAISDDGARVVFEASGLYVRDRALQKTVRVDVAEAGLGESRGEAVFQAAAADGSRVFFSDDARLTRDSKAQRNVFDLYMCELQVAEGAPHCRLTDLSKVLNAGERADVQQRILGLSDSGRYVYFVANGMLTPNSSRGDCFQNGKGTTNRCNLYMVDTVTGEPRLIATLAQRDGPDWGSTGSPDLGLLTSRVSPNGRFLAFMSQRSLTGYDNRDARSGEPDEEVYVYDATNGRLGCASCNPSGARPVGHFDPEEFPGLLVDRSQAWVHQWLAGSIPGWTHVKAGRALYQSRFLSDSGRLFFDSVDALVAQDANGREDVYEYEPDGVGGCRLVAGCVGLMSSGTSGEESAFLDASASGDDVFFLTGAKLATGDVDNAFDVYDAHACASGSACPVAAASVPGACTTTDSCRVAPSRQPSGFGAPSSATFSGPGNMPGAGSVAVVAPRSLNRPLKACHRKRNRARRAVCERQARRRYGSSRALSATKRMGG